MTTLAAKVATVLVLAISLAGAGRIGHLAEPSVVSAAGLSLSQQERLDKAASASLFGQFRSSVADFLWLKVDKYTHNGVEIRGLTQAEKTGAVKAGSVKADAVKSAGGKDAEGMRAHSGSETTVIPSANRDWRGPLGALEREVQPYQDMSHHKHRDPKETLPLFRLMTLSNPHFIPGYTTGAAMIARDKTRYIEAIDFLIEGERQNPDSIEIQTALGLLMTAKTRTYARALPHLQKAIALGAARDKKLFAEDEEEAYQNAFRWLILNRREARDPVAARRAAEACLRVYPDDVVSHHYLSGDTSASKDADAVIEDGAAP